MKKHIYIYSPSSAVRDKASFKRGIKRLKALGHEVELDEAALAKFQRFAGDDETRLAAIHRAAASGADVALITRGGYGLTRILPAINYKAVARSIDKGTKFVGLSDFTALQMALLAKAGAITWAGPALGEDFGTAHTSDDIMEACFDDLISGQGEGTGWQLPKPPQLNTINSVAARAVKKGAARQFSIKNAPLWGGNLAVLVSLIGTPYFPKPDTIKGGILFIEDVGEHPYRVERILTHMLHAGVLASQKAIVFGQFSNYKLVPGYDSGFNLTSVAARLQSQVKAQVLMGLPFGHVATKVLLPVGATVTLAVEGRDALVFWGHQH
ncbi:MAG: LD-carboxypeptidase [Vitreoscilla sp.]|nr:LD-carboxypeptidase [Polaromonas sp.]